MDTNKSIEEDSGGYSGIIVAAHEISIQMFRSETHTCRHPIAPFH